MMLALRRDGSTSPPIASGELATCPNCSGDVRGKRGPIVAHHWAHVADDCDPWSEPETAWHLQWKRWALEQGCAVEVPIDDGDLRHRADAVTMSGMVIEFQHSAIDPDELRQREAFYGRMVWVFDAIAAARDERIDVRDRGAYVSFRWKHPRKTVGYASRPVYLDLGERMLRVARIYTDAPCGGWGRVVDRRDILAGREHPDEVRRNVYANASRGGDA